MKLKRGLQWFALVVGTSILVGVAIIGISAAYPLVTNPTVKTEHQGTIEQRFTALAGGTTQYHFIVNETGTLQDIQTDAVTWYTRQIGDSYTWRTEETRTLATVLPPFFLVGFGFIGAMIWGLELADKMWPTKPEAIE